MQIIDLKNIGLIGQFFSGIAASVLAITALLARNNYKRQVNLEQMKWLQSLYESFYASQTYKSIRQLIDFDDLHEILKLLHLEDIDAAKLNPAQRNQLDAFTDYLNFFEWIGFLEKEGQLTLDQVDVMFKYYLVRLLQVDKERSFRNYIEKKGYEQLDRLLNHYSPVRVGQI